MKIRPRDPEFHQIEQNNEDIVRAAAERIAAAHDGNNCKLCNSGPEIPFSMAFQPIVDAKAGEIVAYEALARGPKGEPASTILDHTLHNNRYSIDQRCREKAIALSAALGILDSGADLSINFYPNAVYQPKQCLLRTINMAKSVAFPLDRIIFEISEVEEVKDHSHLREIMAEYKSHGLRVAIDDFGAGHSGLGLLSEFQPDIIKIDMAIIKEIHLRKASQSIVRSIVHLCRELNTTIIAEGIECEEQMQTLCALGVFKMQGFYFARPAFEALPLWPQD